jgi:predicted dehydrogenase
MFIAGVTGVLEPPINDLWTVPGEENLISEWQEQDLRTFQKIDPGYHYHKLQDQDFLNAILEDRDPLVTGKDGRKLVEIFTAIYRSNRSRSPIDFPLDSYDGFDDFDGRLYQKNGK